MREKKGPSVFLHPLPSPWGHDLAGAPLKLTVPSASADRKGGSSHEGETRLLKSREFSPIKRIVGEFLRQVPEQVSGLAAILVPQGRYGE